MKSIISFHTKHDANLSISIDGEIILILELERIFQKRYFESSEDPEEFKQQWSEVFEIVFNYSGMSEFDIAITNWVKPSKVDILKGLIKAKTWLKCDHHLAHAALGYYDSTFKNPLILSYDGGGNDGVFNFYHVLNNEIIRIERKLLNLGAAYRLLATLMPEITNNQAQPRGGHLALSGKLMGYSALGSVKENWIVPLENYFRFYQYPAQAIYSLSNELELDFEEGSTLENGIARDLAATEQRAIENIVLSEIKSKIGNYNYDGIVLTGGVALNVLINSLISKTFNLPVHVPSAPGDCGISTGSIYALFPPEKKQELTYLGLPIKNNLSESINRRSKKYTLKTLAHLLVNENAMIGVARNRSEVGPRALGNRSIICYPDSKEKKEIINSKIKHREWFRPLAPVIKKDKCDIFFQEKIESPYMSFAYTFKKELRGRFAAVEHFDFSARVQTVTETQNNWLYELLDEIENLTGFPILLNTSFNTKGKPLLTDANEAFLIFKETDLTHLIINDALFFKEEFL